MKNFILSAILLCVAFSSFAQLSTRTMNWDGTDRQYLEYVPEIYTGETPVPIVICLHGLGDNMTNFSNIGMHDIADTANFIVITPQALVAYYMTYEIGTAWNSGASMYGIVPNADVDDSGFIMAILDSAENNFNIDASRVYIVGFSMGGYMTNRLGSEHGDRIEAIASVSGTFGNTITPSPVSPISSLHFHGTIDETVPYTANTSGMDAEELVSFWVDFNNANSTPDVYSYPDTEADGVTFERYIYNDGDENTYNCFIKIIGGEHTWYYYPVNDIDYAIEIWRFFTKSLLNTGINNSASVKCVVSPNPANENVCVKTDDTMLGAILTILDISGKVMYKDVVDAGSLNIDVTSFPAGFYTISISNENQIKNLKLIKQ